MREQKIDPKNIGGAVQMKLANLGCQAWEQIVEVLVDIGRLDEDKKERKTKKKQ